MLVLRLSSIVLLCLILLSGKQVLQGQTFYDDLNISFSQTFIVPQSVQSNDQCGKFYSIFTYETQSAIVFEKIGGSGSSLFNINRTTGEITVIGSSLQAEDCELIIRTVDGLISDVDTAYIKVIANSKCVFIDPSYSGTMDGSRSRPYNSWVKVEGTWKDGYAYFQKRGTIYYGNGIRITHPGSSPADYIYLAAYGKGIRPTWDGKNNSVAVPSITVGTWEEAASYVDIRSFIVRNSLGIETDPGTNHVNISSCDLHDCLHSGCIYLYHHLENPTYIANVHLENIVASGSEEHGIKIQASGCSAFNVRAYDNVSAGLKFALESSHCSAKYILAYDNGTNGLTLDGDYLDISNCRVCSNTRMGYRFGNYNKGSVLTACIAYSNGICGAIVFESTSDLIIEESYFFKNEIGIRVLENASNITMRQNRLYSNSEYGLRIDDFNGLAANINLYYNLIYDNTEEGIYLHGVSNLSIFNNTLPNGRIYITPSSANTGIIIRNTITKDIIGNHSGSKNILSPSVNLFTNYTNKDFSLRSTASAAIDKALNMNQYYDIVGTSVPQGNEPDIGAFEYIVVNGSAPVKPTSLKTLEFNENFVSLIWIDNSDNEVWFQIQRADESMNFQHLAYVEANKESYINNDVVLGSEYHYRVRAFNIYGNSDFSNTIQVNIPSQGLIPNAPTDLIASHIDHIKVEIQWTDNSGNENVFEIQRADESLNYVVLAYAPMNSVSFADNSVQHGATYNYRVRAQNILGYSDFTNSIQTIIPVQGEPPQGPSEFTGLNDHYKKINLSWNDNSFSESGFQLQRADTSLLFFDIDSLSENTSHYIDSFNLIPLETYYYRLRAYNEYGNSEFSDTLSFTIFDIDLPDPPTLLDASEISHAEIKISWQDNSTNETGFVIKRAPYPSEEFDAIRSISENSSSYVDDKIIPGETYYYVVNAVNEKGESENSNKIRITSLSLNDSLRVNSGLIVLYNFSLLSDSIIVDRSRFGTPLDLILKNADGTNLKKSEKLEIKSNTFIQSQEIAFKIIDACKLTNEISVECWLKSKVSLDFIPLKIIALQNDSAQGFALSCFSDETDPDKIKYAINLTTATTDEQGNPLFPMEIAADAEVLQHVVFTHSNTGDERIYLNSQEVSLGFRPADYKNWMDNYTLDFGNGSKNNSPWLGDLYLCSFYNRALSAEEIQINYLASPFSNLDYMLNPHTYEIVTFPNPSNGILNVSILNLDDLTDITEKYFIRIVDLMGRTIYNQDITDKIDDKSFELNVSYLNSGFYSIVLFNQNELIDASKLIINH